MRRLLSVLLLTLCAQSANTQTQTQQAASTPAQHAIPADVAKRLAAAQTDFEKLRREVQAAQARLQGTLLEAGLRAGLSLAELQYCQTQANASGMMFICQPPPAPAPPPKPEAPKPPEAQPEK